MRHTVDDEYDLEPPPPMTNGRRDYIRTLCDHHVLVSYETGDLYWRRDGGVWQWPAYIVRRECNSTQIIGRPQLDKVVVEPSGTWADSKVYPSSQDAAA